jgi:acyl-CoA thioester hydrolase
MVEFETYRGTVYPWHCDFNGHMNVMYYVGKFDEATWHFFTHFGITPSYLKSEKRGMVAVEQNLKYFEELNAGDLIYIKTQLIELKSKAIVFIHQMFNAETNTLAAEGRMVGVHIDLESRKSVSFPPSISKKINSNLSHH